jgi:hypothetical protein
MNELTATQEGPWGRWSQVYHCDGEQVVCLMRVCRRRGREATSIKPGSSCTLAPFIGRAKDTRLLSGSVDSDPAPWRWRLDPSMSRSIDVPATAPLSVAPAPSPKSQLKISVHRVRREFLPPQSCAEVDNLFCRGRPENQAIARRAFCFKAGEGTLKTGGSCWAHRPPPTFFHVGVSRWLLFAPSLFFSLHFYPSFDPPQLALRFFRPRTRCLTAPSPSSTFLPVTTPSEGRCLPRSRSSRRRSFWVAPETTSRAALWVARLASL